jgi:hypothetical protein
MQEEDPLGPADTQGADNALLDSGELVGGRSEYWSRARKKSLAGLRFLRHIFYSNFAQ